MALGTSCPVQHLYMARNLPFGWSFKHGLNDIISDDCIERWLDPSMLRTTALLCANATQTLLPTHTPALPTSNMDQGSLKLAANYFVAGFLLSTGATALLSPTTLAAGFGMPVEDGTFAAGFIQCMGGRNLTFGIISAIFVQRGDFRSAGTMATLLALDGFVDGLVTYRYAGWLASAPHFVAAAIIPFVSGWMSS